MLSFKESSFIALFLEGFTFGLYSGIFAMYLQKQTSDKSTNATATKHPLFYPICILYALSFAFFFCDTCNATLPLSDGAHLNHGEVQTVLRLDYISPILVGCCDFISQSILIYRCWIIWNRKIIVVIVPLILAFVFMATWLAGMGSYSLTSNSRIVVAFWSYTVHLTSLVISSFVNALVTGLIVLRIFKVYRRVDPFLYDDPTSNANYPRATGGPFQRKLRPIMFMLIESGMIMFVIQLVRIVMVVTYPEVASLLIGINEMLFGITPTIIVVRVSMELSYHDESSMIEATASVCSVSNDSTSMPEMESITFAVQEGGDDVSIQN